MELLLLERGRVNNICYKFRMQLIMVKAICKCPNAFDNHFFRNRLLESVLGHAVIVWNS